MTAPVRAGVLRRHRRGRRLRSCSTIMQSPPDRGCGEPHPQVANRRKRRRRGAQAQTVAPSAWRPTERFDERIVAYYPHPVTRHGYPPPAGHSVHRARDRLELNVTDFCAALPPYVFQGGRAAVRHDDDAVIARADSLRCTTAQRLPPGIIGMMVARRAPGSKVVHRSANAPCTVALGIVTADGGRVVWLDVVEVGPDGTPRRRATGGAVCRTPLPLRGDEIACPEELLSFYPGETERLRGP